MEFFEVIHTQRSIRRFKPDPIPDGEIWALIDAAIKAPSGSNQQPWIWMVVRDAAKRHAIAEATRRYMESAGRFEEMERAAETVQDPSRKRSVRGAVEFFRDVAAAPVLIIPCLVSVTSPVTDPRTLLAGSSIYGAVQNLMLAARAMGIGTVLTTFNQFIEDSLRIELGIPADVVPTCIVPVGYPDGQRFGPTTRKPAEAVTYWDGWGSANSRG